MGINNVIEDWGDEVLEDELLFEGHQVTLIICRVIKWK